MDRLSANAQVAVFAVAIAVLGVVFLLAGIKYGIQAIVIAAVLLVAVGISAWRR